MLVVGQCHGYIMFQLYILYIVYCGTFFVHAKMRYPANMRYPAI